MPLKKYIAVVSLLLGLVLLSGCFSQVTEKQGGVQITLKIPPQLQSENAVAPQYLNYDLRLKEATVTLTKGAQIVTQTVPASNETLTLTFNNLEEGVWQVNAVGRDNYSTEVYKGTSTITVQSGVVASFDVDMALLPGDLEIRVPVSVGVASGKVTLTEMGTGQVLTANLTIDGVTGKAIFKQLHSTTWKLKIELFDGSGVLICSDEEPVDVLPGVCSIATIDLNNGNISISIIWELNPEKPTGLSATCDEHGVALIWNPNTETNLGGYNVLRARTLTDKKQYVNGSLLTNPAYVDTVVTTGDAYYYWVQAYDQHGNASDLSNPLYVSYSPVPETIENAVLAYTSNVNGYLRLSIIDATGKILKQVARDNGHVIEPSWSPDGSKIAFMISDTEGTNIYVFDVTTGLTSCVVNSGDVQVPQWSPDGSKILFHRTMLGAEETWVVNADGSNAHKVTTGYLASWSPDGQRIVFVDRNPALANSSCLYVSDITGLNRTRLSPEEGLFDSPVWSSRNQIAYSLTLPNQPQNSLYVINPDGTSHQFIANGMYPQWSHDGSKLAYNLMDTTNSLAVYNVDTNNYQVMGQDIRSTVIRWRADDSQLIFLGYKGTPNANVFQVNSDGTGLTTWSIADYLQAFMEISPKF